MNAFRKLINSNQKFAFAVAFKLLCDDNDARDAVQESFIRVWKHIHNYNENMKFTTWLYKIITNICYDKMKSKKRKQRVFENFEDGYDNLVKYSTDKLNSEMDNKQLADLINNLAGKLKPKQRMVFVLRDIENLSVNEVAEVMKISKSSVKTNLVYARQNIKEKLKCIEKNW